MNPSNPWQRRGILVGAVACLILLVIFLLSPGFTAATDARPSATGDWIPVKRGDFEILCREEGDLRPVKVTTITFLRWGRISYLAPEGTYVKKGDKVIGLETRDLQEELQRMQEDLAVAERDLAQREQSRDLEIKRLNTDLNTEKERAAVSALKERELLAKPIPTDQEEARNLLDGAKARLANAEADLAAYKPLAEKGFGRGSDTAAKELAVSRAQVELERAQIKCRQIMDGALPIDREIIKLERENSELGLKVQEITGADQTDSLSAKVHSAERLVAHLQRKYERRKLDLERSMIFAPHDGIVVHRISDWRSYRKPELGDYVGPWSSPVDLPSYDKMKVRTQVPESFIRKLTARESGRDAADAPSSNSAPLTRGSKCRVVVKTQPDRVYPAEVIWIDGWARDRNSKLSEADMRAQGLSGVRVFDVEVELEESDPQRLREGFRAAVEFPVEVHKDIISVPINAVTDRGGVPHLRVQGDGREEWRKVELGLQSLDRVAVKAGLKESERVFSPRLPPPPRPAEKPPVEEPKAATARPGIPPPGRAMPPGANGMPNPEGGMPSSRFRRDAERGGIGDKSGGGDTPPSGTGGRRSGSSGRRGP